ncbi:MAG: signal recognition particle-docking protein FtsY [Candidatus Nezhaarchaeales archaeon]
MFSRIKQGLQSIISSITTKTLSKESLDKYLSDLEVTLLESDVSLEACDVIINRVKTELADERVKRFTDIKELVKEALAKAILSILKDVDSVDLLKEAEEKRRVGEPLIIVFIGPNGHGKTLTVAKLAKLFMSKGFSTIMACSDTFRAGAEEQIEQHGKRLGIKVIKHKYGADPAAVAYDAVMHAKAKGINVVLVDTAGRLQTDKALMEEMRKIVRVVKPSLTVFVVDALTGNDALEQAKRFNEAVGINGCILTKVDADAKGGAALSIAYAIRKPILYLGNGQGYDDLIPFNPEWWVREILQ